MGYLHDTSQISASPYGAYLQPESAPTTAAYSAYYQQAVPAQQPATGHNLYSTCCQTPAPSLQSTVGYGVPAGVHHARSAVHLRGQAAVPGTGLAALPRGYQPEVQR